MSETSRTISVALGASTPTSSPAKRAARPRWRRAAVAVVAILALAGLGVALAPRGASSDGGGATAVVTRGSLLISITEAGEIEAKTSVKVANELPWSVVITRVLPEGTLVKKGDVIIGFDCQDLTDSIDKEQLAVTSAEGDYAAARENLELVGKQAANNIAKSDQKVIDAQESLNRYIEGDGPLSIKNAESDVQVAQRDVALAQDKLEFKLKVNQDPELNSPYSANEIKAETLGVERLHLVLEKAESTLLMLKKYEYPKQIRTLKMDLEDAKLDLEHDHIEGKTNVATAQANERSKNQSLKKQKEVLDELLTKQKKLTVRAVQSGLVVYTANKNRRGNDVTIEVGEKIDPNRQLMMVPDMTTLQVRTKVYESMIEQVRRDLPAFVRLDSRPDLTLTGKVGDVSVLPDSSQWWSPDVKVFSVVVKLDREPPGLKPGMTAQVEMVLAELPADTLSVPVAAVFSEQEEHYAWRVRGAAAEKVPVKIGRMSDTRVQILQGLAEGDVVRLSQPLDKHQPAGNEQEANTPAKDKPKK